MKLAGPRAAATAALLFATVSAVAGTGLADTPAAGFSVAKRGAAPSINLDPFGLSFDIHGVGIDLAGGDLVGFDGTHIVRKAADGTLLATYHTVSTPVYPSLLAVDASETLLVVGESSTGAIYRVDLVSGQASQLTTIAFNYDAAFSATGELYVSHGTTVLGGGTGISRVDTTTGAAETVALVSGPSGPLAFDASGGLAYGLVAPFVAAASSQVVRWTQAQLAGTTVLGEADAELVSSGWDGVGFLAHDPETDEVLLIENDFAGPPEVWRAAATKAGSKLVASGPTGTFMSNLQFESDPGPSLFEAFQPADGGRLRYNLSDFIAGTLERYEVRPERPVTWVSGPGTVGAGAVTLGVSGARPGGIVVFWYTAADYFEAQESVFFLPDLPPLFWQFGKSPAYGLPYYLPVDGNGEGTFTFYNPGFYQGQLAFQAMVADLTIAVEGTATAVRL